MRDLTELNINEGGRPVKRPPPSSGQVADFERHSAIILPPSYLALLRHANGGHPELDSMEPANGGSRWAVNTFFHLSDDKTESGSLWRAAETWQQILGKAALPIANDGGGNVFFIDTASNSGAVKVCIHDDNFAVRDLAASFEDFIDRLSIDPDFI